LATAARKKTYNPYDDVKAITEYKGNYHTAKEMGGDYLQWQKKAVENYNNLIENGYRDVADELTASDYTKSLDVLKRYQPTTIADDYYSAVTGDLIEESKTPKLSESAQKLFDSYYSTDNTLNGAVTKDSSGNVVSGLNIDHYNKTMAYRRGKTVFLLNFHPDRSLENYFVPVKDPGKYQVILSTDDYRFGGDGRIYHQSYESVKENGRHGIRLYLPSRTAAVLVEEK